MSSVSPKRGLTEASDSFALCSYRYCPRPKPLYRTIYHTRTEIQLQIGNQPLQVFGRVMFIKGFHQH